MDTLRGMCLASAAVGAILLLAAPKAQPTASFSRQTGLPCSTCHTTFPELTEFGRAFKLNGYTLSSKPNVEEKGKGKTTGLSLIESLPLSINLRASLTQTGNVQPGTRNTNFEVPQQVNFWIAGKIAEHLGSYIQMTYNVQKDHFSFDNSDVRYARATKAKGKDLTWGIDFNNNPTFEDLWQSTPAYGFPWAAPDAVPTPAAATIIDTTLGGDVVGLGAYGMWNSHLYGDVSVYRSQHIGAPQPATGVGFAHNIHGAAPYWRFAYQASKGRNYFEAGTYGIYAQSFPNAITGPTDHFTDTALDLTYERKFNSDVLALHSTYIYEKTDLTATFLAGLATRPTHHLETARWDAGYHFGNKYTVTAGSFYTFGSADSLLFNGGAPPAPVAGSANGNPRTGGYITQFAWWPIQNLEIGLQYKGYLKYNGATHNYDGFGRAASGNNTTYLFLWFNF